MDGNVGWLTSELMPLAYRGLYLPQVERAIVLLVLMCTLDLARVPLQVAEMKGEDGLGPLGFILLE